MQPLSITYVRPYPTGLLNIEDPQDSVLKL